MNFMFSLRVCWLLAAELNTGFARHFVLHRQNIIFIQPWQLYTLATLEDTGSVSDSSSVSESEIPYSTRILLMTVEKLNFEEGRISTFLLCAWSRGLEGEARPILPAPPRALHALGRWRAWSVQLQIMHGDKDHSWSKTLQQSQVGILFYQNNKYMFSTAEESIISITWSW